LPPIEIPPDFAEAVMARLPTVRRAVLPRLVKVLAGTAALAAALLGYYLVSGETLAGAVVSAARYVIRFVSLAGPLAAKGFKLLRLLFDIALDIGKIALKGLGLFASLLTPEVIGVVLIMGFAVSFLAVLGLKKIVSLGEKS
jgi:hypothetical protein